MWLSDEGPLTLCTPCIWQGLTLLESAVAWSTLQFEHNTSIAGL